MSSPPENASTTFSRVVLVEGHYDLGNLTSLPPLIKGYLRLGGFVGDGAVIDPQFNTTDVAVVVQTDLVTDKYYKHYERQRGETAA